MHLQKIQHKNLKTENKYFAGFMRYFWVFIAVFTKHLAVFFEIKQIKGWQNKIFMHDRTLISF